MTRRKAGHTSGTQLPTAVDQTAGRGDRRRGRLCVVNRTGHQAKPAASSAILAAVIGRRACCHVRLATGGGATGGMLLLVIGGWGCVTVPARVRARVRGLQGRRLRGRPKGYLTLDPRRYTDPVFSIVLPLLFLLIGGIPLPGGAVLDQPPRAALPQMDCLVSLAGPLSNLAVGIVLTWSCGAVPTAVAAWSAAPVLPGPAAVPRVHPQHPADPGPGRLGRDRAVAVAGGQAVRREVRPWAPLVLFAVADRPARSSQALFEGADASSACSRPGRGGRHAVLATSGHRPWGTTCPLLVSQQAGRRQPLSTCEDAPL